jgi:hypothetical protein
MAYCLDFRRERNIATNPFAVNGSSDRKKTEEDLMKRIIILVAFLAVLSVPAFSQFRLDLGVDIPMTIGVIGSGELDTSNEAGEFLRSHWLPFPEAGLYYQFDLGLIKLAPGIRVFTFILESVIWPNLMMEIALDPVFIQAQVGGLLFAFFGLANDAQYGEVFFPDLSVWFGLGKQRRFRIGAGAIGLYWPELTTEGMAFAPYIGAKVSLLFEGE